MASLFTVSEGDAASFQQQYQRLIEEFVETLLNLQDREKERVVQIFDKERLVYSSDSKQIQDEISGFTGKLLHPEIIEQLEQMRDTPVGGIVESARNKRVELDGRIVLQSDEQGMVIVNELREPEIANNEIFQPLNEENLAGLINSEDGKAPEIPEEDKLAENYQSLPKFETERINDLVASVRQGLQSKDYAKIEEAMYEVPYPARKSAISFLSETERQEAKKLKEHFMAEGLAGIRTDSLMTSEIPTVNQRRNLGLEEQQENLERGSERILRSLEKLPDSPTKKLVSSYTQEIQTLLQISQAQANQINELQRSVRELTQQLTQQRLAQPENKSWWDETLITFSSAWEKWNQSLRQHQAASAIRTLYANQTVDGAKVLQLAEYRIEREGKNYTFSDNYGQVLMRFKSTKLGVRVDSESIQMKHNHYQDIELLKTQQSRNEQPDGAFSRPGAREGIKEFDRYMRSQTITSALIEYAKKLGKDVMLDGEFSYKWKAKLDGEVKIYAKDGRGLILAQAGNQMISRMTPQDFGYFEEALTKLRSHETSRITPISSRQRRKENDVER
ncbi:hypothetical protein [Floridanema evergladense]|uniref:Uncharacterized protein n=1 Tax=Floridaenema evergladense BLCC-F167 TaxID=3153639 RepID=A0ABV4WGN6_9CYAN